LTKAVGPNGSFKIGVVGLDFRRLSEAELQENVRKGVFLCDEKYGRGHIC